MPREFKRKVRIAESIKRLLAEPLTLAGRDAGIGLLTVTEVEVPADLSTAKVFVSAFGGNATREVVIALLHDLRAEMRQIIARDLRLKMAPMLFFELDDSIANGARINELLTERPH